MISSIAPHSRRDNTIDTLHGVDIPDPYRWLEDQDSPETRAWLDDQMVYTHQTLAGYSGRNEIHDRLTELMKIDSTSQPLSRNDSYFFMRRRINDQQYIIYRRRSLHGPNAQDEVLVNPHPMSPDQSVSVNLYGVSQDGSMLAYSVRRGGSDEVEVRLRDTDTLLDLPDVLPAERYSGFEFTSDGAAFFYSLNTVNGPRVRLHRIGGSLEDDTEIFGADLGPDKIVGIRMSDNAEYLLITIYYGSSGSKTEIHVVDLKFGLTVRPIVDNVDARFFAQAADGALYLQSNWNAPNGRLFRLDINTKTNSPDCWREIVPEHQDSVLQNFSLVDGKLFLNYLENVSSRVFICDAEGHDKRGIQLPGIGTVSAPIGKWDSAEIFFAFGSFAVPPAIFRYDTKTTVCEVWAKSDVPLNLNAIEVRQVWFTSGDGARVPMFLVHAKNLEMDCNRPVYMTGYGGFTVSRTPAFSALAVLWAELGGIYAVPNLRGGGEFGEEWHTAGMLEKKQNVFDDFYAAGEWLINSGYTSPAKLGIAGRSNGGLLVGAAITQRPELFGAAICGYPLLDMIRYQKFLVAGYWIPEYGTSDDPDQFQYLYAYSPYHHVRIRVQYPAIMFVTGDSDTRVAPLHARKMTARMQTESNSDSLVLLHYDVKSGHSDGKPINQTVEDATDEVLFLLRNLGV